MSIGSFTPSSDQSYATNALWTLEKTKEWILGDEGSVGLINFGRLLDDMKNRAGFQPPFRSNHPELTFAGNPLYYREPVWRLIHEVATRHATRPLTSEKECADWLFESLELLVKRRKSKKLVEEFAAKLQAEKITYTVGEGGCGWIADHS